MRRGPIVEVKQASPSRRPQRRRSGQLPDKDTDTHQPAHSRPAGGNVTRKIPSQAERPLTCARATATAPIDRPSRAAEQARLFLPLAASSHGGDLAPDRGAASPVGEARRLDRGRRGQGRAPGAGAGGRQRRAAGRRGAVPGLGPRAAPGAGRLRARAPHPRPLPLQGSCAPSSLLARLGFVRCSSGSKLSKINTRENGRMLPALRSSPPLIKVCEQKLLLNW